MERERERERERKRYLTVVMTCSNCIRCVVTIFYVTLRRSSERGVPSFSTCNTWQGLVSIGIPTGVDGTLETFVVLQMKARETQALLTVRGLGVTGGAAASAKGARACTFIGLVGTGRACIGIFFIIRLQEGSTSILWCGRGVGAASLQGRLLLAQLQIAAVCLVHTLGEGITGEVDQLVATVVVNTSTARCDGRGHLSVRRHLSHYCRLLAAVGCLQKPSFVGGFGRGSRRKG